MYKIQSHIKPPKLRRERGSMTATEIRMFEAFVAAYQSAHNCKLTRTHFDVESRIATFKGPTFTLAHTARRCKELTKQLRFRKV